MADERERDPTADYETAKEWEFDASARAMLSIRPDIEQLPLLNPRGQQVGIGVGLIWSVDERGEPQWRLEDDSRRCVDAQSCWEEICDTVEDDL